MKLKHLIHNIILIVALLNGATAWAQDSTTVPPHYSFQIDSTTLLLGDQTQLTIAAGTRYPTQDELSNNDILAINGWIDTTDGTMHVTLTSFEEGEHWYHIGDDSVLITVNDVAGVDTTKAEIRDIGNILRQPITQQEIQQLKYLFVGIWALAAIIALVWLRIKHKKPIISLPQAPPLPADTQALNALETLRQQQLWQQGKIKEYHTLLTDILRKYLFQAFGIQSAEMTTDQTLDAFRCTSACTRDNETLLRQVLQTADMVKFAKSEPLPYQHDQSFNNTATFIKDSFESQVASSNLAETPDTNSSPSTTNHNSQL